MLGADVRYVHGEEEYQRHVVEAVADEATRRGERPIVLESEPIIDVGSALGDAGCSVEVVEQLDAFETHLRYLSMTSGGKLQAGLVPSQKLPDARYVIHGVNVSCEYDVAPNTACIVNDALTHLGGSLLQVPSSVLKRYLTRYRGAPPVSRDARGGGSP